MNLLKFWFLRTIHPTTNKKPKSKYASYIFFSQKTRRYFMYLSSQKSLTRRIRCRLFWTSLFEVLTSYFKSGRHLLPERKVDKFQSHTKTECSSICYFGEGGSSRVKFLMNPMNKLNKQPRIAGRFFLECYDHTASKYVQEKCPKK